MSPALRTLPRRILVLFVTLFVAIAALVATAAPAAAHDQLIGSTPAADATVEGLPAELVLTFSAVISADPGASEVQVTDAAGTALAGDPVADGTALTVPLEGDASGAVSVLWKVVSSDGHPISGEFAFTVTPAAAPTDTPTATPTPTSAPTETAPSETASPEVTAAPEPAGDDVDMTPWIIAGVLLLVAVGAAVLYLLVSRARRREALRNSAGTTPDAGSDTPSER